jgi:hypothetical protein
MRMRTVVAVGVRPIEARLSYTVKAPEICFAAQRPVSKQLKDTMSGEMLLPALQTAAAPVTLATTAGLRGNMGSTGKYWSSTGNISENGTITEYWRRTAQGANVSVEEGGRYARQWLHALRTELSLSRRL